MTGFIKLILLSISSIYAKEESLVNEFCDTDHTLEHVYTIGNQIHLGFNASIISFNFELNSFTGMRSFRNLFDKNTPMIDKLITAVHINIDECNITLFSEEYCNRTVYAKNLVIVIGIANAITRFYSFRWINDKTSLEYINNDQSLPWNMTNTGQLYNDEFWRIPSYTNLTGLTFISIETYNILFATTTISSRNEGLLYQRMINTNGIIDSEWYSCGNIVWRSASNNLFKGLFVFRDHFIIFDDKNYFHKYIIETESLKYVGKITSKQFFGCKPIESVTDATNNPYSVETSTTDTLPTNTTKWSSDTFSLSPIITTPAMNRKTIFAKYSTILSLFTLFIVMITALIVIVVFVLLRDNSKTEESAEEKSVETVVVLESEKTDSGETSNITEDEEETVRSDLKIPTSDDTIRSQ